MNLKYYLRGLGLGIIVTALILGIHYSRVSKPTMTDAEIKKRAEALGMVESGSLTQMAEQSQKDDAIKSAEELLESLEAEELSTADDQVETDVDEPVEESLEVEEESAETTEDIVDIVDDESLQQQDTDVTDDTIEQDTQPVMQVTDVSSSITLNIASGDSSYTVAKKLVDLGLVDDASDYDTYLCNGGYDRYIKAGTYEIPVDSSNETIAHMITGK